MNKVLVVYGTKSGCTEGIAERIGAKLAECGATVDVLLAEKAGAPTGYDAVVVGSGVRAGTWHKSASEWVASNAASLKATPVALFTVGLTPATEPEKTEEVRAYSKPVEEAAGIRPVEVGTFAGWFEPDKFSFLERTILSAMKAPKGDFRDWDAIDAWTQQVAPKLGVA